MCRLVAVDDGSRIRRMVLRLPVSCGGRRLARRGERSFGSGWHGRRFLDLADHRTDGRSFGREAGRCDVVPAIAELPELDGFGFASGEGLPSLDLRAITAHPDGSVWVATNAGLARTEPAA